MSTPTSDPGIEALRKRISALPTDFHNLADVYDANIRPDLMEKEACRLAAANKARNFAILGGVGGVAGVGLAIFLAKLPILAFFLGIAGFGLAAFGQTDLARIRKEAKTLIVTPVAEELGITYSESPDGSALTTLQEARSLALVPSWDRKALSDQMFGERAGSPFQFFEAHLEEKRRSTDSKGRTRTYWVTVFQGQIWQFQAPKEFYGTTRVARDMGWFNALGALGSKFDRARLESPDFEKLFEVFTTDQVEARYLLTPDVMQAILDLEKAFHGARIRLAFSNGYIYAAAEGGNLFEPGTMFKPLDNPERVGDLFEEFASVFRMIDTLRR